MSDVQHVVSPAVIELPVDAVLDLIAEECEKSKCEVPAVIPII